MQPMAVKYYWTALHTVMASWVRPKFVLLEQSFLQLIYFETQWTSTLWLKKIPSESQRISGQLHSAVYYHSISARITFTSTKKSILTLLVGQ